MELKGRAASVGTVTATARVITDIKDAGVLNEGDILITRMTGPDWTYLFPKLGGIVTEIGGILSHPAIIARETGIPAVVSVPNATDIPDGSKVFLDGRKGIVRVL